MKKLILATAICAIATGAFAEGKRKTTVATAAHIEQDMVGSSENTFLPIFWFFAILLLK